LFKVKNKLGIFSRVAKGNVLVISPFNYPISTPLSKIISALVTGNSVVFKPSTQGSLVALFLGKLTSDVGFPKGIINIVTGRGSEISNLILKNNVFNVVTFTGSTKVGKLISEKVTKTELILELGGKDTSLVLDDVEVEEVSTKLIKGAFQFSGQRCTAVKRVLVTEKVADQLVESLKEKIKELSSSEIKLKELIVPLISLKSANYAFSLIEDAGKQKADVIVGGQQKANFLYPTLIDHVNLKMKIAHEEQFAPIIPVIRIKS
jgi:glyceraldehyde-3-phosphate dehydrogenase (NADP+)